MTNNCNRNQYGDAGVVLPGIRRVQFDAETITSFTIENLTVAAADTEQSYALPSGTKGFEIRARGGTGVIKLSFTSGESGTKYRAIPYGVSWGKTGLDTATSWTLYFQSSKSGFTVEVVSWA